MANHRRDYVRIPKGGSWGNKVDRETFVYCITEVINGRMTQGVAAKKCGISYPTFVKWANKWFYGEPIPDTFFKVEKKDGQS